MKIAMLAPTPGTRGAVPRIADDLAGTLRALGHDVELVSWGRHTDSESPIGKIVRRPVDAIRLGRWIRRGRYDVVYVHTGFDRRTLPRDVLLLAVAGRGVGRVIELHGGRTDLLLAPGRAIFKTLARVLVRMCDSILTLSNDDAAALLGIGARRVHAVRNPLARDFEDVDYTRERDSRDVLFAGRLVPEKGVLDLIDAWANVDARLEGTLLIAGDGPLRDVVAKRIDSLGLSGRVALVGHVDRDGMHALYRRASVFVLPSYREGFPTVVAEAMAYGLAVVTTPVDGVRDWLREPGNAILVDPGDVPGITAALERLLTNEALRWDMGVANRLAVERFLVREVADEIEERLAEVDRIRHAT